MNSSDLLTEREIQVLTLAAKGLSNKALAKRLGIVPRTVEVHLSRIYQKLEVTSRTEAVVKALRVGLIV